MGPLTVKMLKFLASAAYVLLSMLPGGTTLCLGGGHHWSEMIAARCEHDDQHHVASHEIRGHDEHQTNHHSAPGGKSWDACGGCAHHEQDHDEPCTDIAAPGFVARVQQGERLQHAGGDDIASSMPAPAFASLHRWTCFYGPATDPSTLESAGQRCGGPPREVQLLLRAVILTI